MPIICLWIFIGLLGLILYMFQFNISSIHKEGFVSNYPSDFRTLLNLVDSDFQNVSNVKSNPSKLDEQEQKSSSNKLRYKTVKQNEKSLADPTFFASSNEEPKGKFLDPLIRNNAVIVADVKKNSSLDQGKEFQKNTQNLIQSSKPPTNMVNGESKYDNVLSSIDKIGNSLELPPDLKNITSCPPCEVCKPCKQSVEIKCPSCPELKCPKPQCPKPKCPPQKKCPNMQNYIRKDQIPCWGCNLE